MGKRSNQDWEYICSLGEGKYLWLINVPFCQCFVRTDAYGNYEDIPTKEAISLLETSPEEEEENDSKFKIWLRKLMR